MPLVSIGLPVFNGENFIEAALDSLLSQTFEQFELIISDNASTDRTQEICRSYCNRDKRIRYFCNQKNLGAAYNFNRVFNLSAGKYFMWSAHDDMYAPEFLQKCLVILESEPSIGLCFSNTKFIDERGRFIKDYYYSLDISSPSPAKRFIQIVAANHIVVEIFGLIRANLLKKTPLIGGYAASDRVLLGELALYGPFFKIPEYLFFHREHQQRSTYMHHDNVSYSSWYAPQKKIVFPTWKILAELIAVIERVPVNPTEKLKCYLQLVQWFRMYWKKLRNDLLRPINH